MTSGLRYTYVVIVLKLLKIVKERWKVKILERSEWTQAVIVEGVEGACSNLHTNLISDTNVVNSLTFSWGCFPFEHYSHSFHAFLKIGLGISLTPIPIPQFLCIKLNGWEAGNINNWEHLSGLLKAMGLIPRTNQNKVNKERNVWRLNKMCMLFLDLVLENTKIEARAIKHFRVMYTPEPSGCIYNSGWGDCSKFYCSSLQTAQIFQKQAQNIHIAHLC